MTRLDKYLRAFESTLRLPRRERRSVVAELRSHIEEKVADARRASPGAAEDGLVERVLADLGDPRSLAISYGEKDTIIRTRRGEVAVQVARAIGRGTGTFLKWAGIVFGVLLVVGLVTAYVAYQEAKPYIEQEYVHPLTEFRRDCSTATCSALPAQTTFEAPEGSREVMADIYVTVPQAGGAVQITVKDPEGRTVYDRTVTGGTDPAQVTERATWNGKPGMWTVTLAYTGFRGTIDLDFYARGLAPGTL